jgi:hypothetical protein
LNLGILEGLLRNSEVFIEPIFIVVVVVWMLVMIQQLYFNCKSSHYAASMSSQLKQRMTGEE